MKRESLNRQNQQMTLKLVPTSGRPGDWGPQGGPETGGIVRVHTCVCANTLSARGGTRREGRAN